MKKVIVFLVLFLAVPCFGQDYESSPFNYDNSPYNYENSPYNYRNSRDNWDNSPYKWGNDRIIRDNDGNPQGYAVPKRDGGVNFFDLDGNRKGYEPAPRRRHLDSIE